MPSVHYRKEGKRIIHPSKLLVIVFDCRIGQPGVDSHIFHENSGAVIKLVFLTNQVIALLANSTH